MTTQTISKPNIQLEYVEYFESRYKRSYDKYMQAMTEFSIGGLHDEQILKALAYCECQRLGKYFKEDVLSLNNLMLQDKLQKMKRSVTDDIMNFGISDRLPDINDRVRRIVTRDLNELLDCLIANQ